MAKTIQKLRREKGFRSAREFADALGISPSSMSRYDKNPETIPVKVAWAMADRLDCSIDEIVGRMPVTSGKSELQDFYDGLHRWNKDLFDHISPEELSVLDNPWAMRDGIAALVEEKTEESRYQRARKAVEERYGDSARDESEELEAIHDELDRMEAEEGSVKEVTERIMEAYDRIHPEDEYALLHMDRLT